MADTPEACRREVANQGIPAPTHGHERVDTRLDALGQWQHDARVVRRLDASTSVDIFGPMPAQPRVIDHLKGVADVRAISIRPSPRAGGGTAYGRYALHALGLALPWGQGARVEAEGQLGGYERVG